MLLLINGILIAFKYIWIIYLCFSFSIGGGRDVKCMYYETSLLDAQEGIRFRGYSIPELQVKLPTFKGPAGQGRCNYNPSYISLCIFLLRRTITRGIDMAFVDFWNPDYWTNEILNWGVPSSSNSTSARGIIDSFVTKGNASHDPTFNWCFGLPDTFKICSSLRERCE